MQPEVLTGLRAPQAVRLEEAQQRAATAPAGDFLMPAAAAGFTVYMSKFKRYRVQITAPHSYTDPATGQVRAAGREFAAQFEDGVFINDERDPEFRALIDKTLQSNRYFGTFGSTAHFWLAEEQRKAVSEGRLRGAIATIKSLPAEALAAVMGELRQGAATDHQMPAPAVPETPVDSTPTVPAARRPIPNR